MSSLKIAFIHPDLGIGGAEQLVVNLAVALKQKGNSVKIYTPHHDVNHCFPETIDGTIPVEVKGNQIPPRIFGQATALCAYLRMILCTLSVILWGGFYDVIIVDQVTFCLPLLYLFRRKTIFYCHYPDKLLCVERRSIIKKIYRLFLDFFEEICMFFTNMVLVNSQFTANVVQKSFPIYSKLTKQKPNVLYPAIDFQKFNLPSLNLTRQDSRLNKHSFFLSLNRFERKKNINLAINAFALFREQMKIKQQASESKDDEQFQNIRLVIAGGFENRILENKEHYDELNQLALDQNITEYVSFKRNISDEERTWLLQNCICVLYTPEREHFGIVPVEAMYNEAPIIACNSGGPMESVDHGVTGYLCDTKVDQWQQKMTEIYNDEILAKKLGSNGKQRVIELFSFEAFSNQINKYVNQLCQNKIKLN